MSFKYCICVGLKELGGLRGGAVAWDVCGVGRVVRDAGLSLWLQEGIWTWVGGVGDSERNWRVVM